LAGFSVSRIFVKGDVLPFVCVRLLLKYFHARQLAEECTILHCDDAVLALLINSHELFLKLIAKNVNSELLIKRRRFGENLASKQRPIPPRGAAAHKQQYTKNQQWKKKGCQEPFLIF
jgi:hypothetical protein